MATTAAKAILFDLDNTLMDREALFRRVAQTFYEEHLSVMAKAPQEHVMKMLIRWDEDGFSDRNAMLQRWLNEWPGIGMTLDSLTRWYRSSMDRKTEPDPEINKFLADLNERGLTWGIVTNGGTSSQRSKCKAAGLEKLAQFIIVSEEAGYEKPDPRIFRDSLRLIGLSAPRDVIFVGDSPNADIDGSKRFGMQAAWIRRGRRYPAGLKSPDHVIDKVTDLRALVGI